MKTPIEKKQSIPLLPGAPADAPDSGGSHDDNGPDDLLKFSSGNCHAGHITMPVSLNLVVSVSPLISRSGPDYQEPHLSNLQKPPTV